MEIQQLDRYEQTVSLWSKRDRMETAFQFVLEGLQMYTLEECYSAINSSRKDLKLTAKLKIKLRK